MILFDLSTCHRICMLALMKPFQAFQSQAHGPQISDKCVFHLENMLKTGEKNKMSEANTFSSSVRGHFSNVSTSLWAHRTVSAGVSTGLESRSAAGRGRGLNASTRHDYRCTAEQAKDSPGCRVPVQQRCKTHFDILLSLSLNVFAQWFNTLEYSFNTKRGDAIINAWEKIVKH